MHTRRATYDRDRVFTAWLFAIARYKMIDYFRRTRRHQTIEGLEEILTIEGFEDATSARMDVDDLLEILPPKQARMIRATRLDGLSVAEAAESGWKMCRGNRRVCDGIAALIRASGDNLWAETGKVVVPHGTTYDPVFTITGFAQVRHRWRVYRRVRCQGGRHGL